MAAFQQACQAAFSCLTRVQVKAAGGARTSGDHTLAFTQPLAPLGRNRALVMRLRHSYRVVQTPAGWTVRTVGYSYWLYDADGSELAVYQWDPTGPSPVRTPHIHIGKGLSSGDVPEPIRRCFERLAAAHLPTGFIPVTEILRAVIRDFGVEPLRRVPGDASSIDWDGIDRLFREAETILNESFE